MGVAGGVSCTRRVLYSGCGWGMSCTKRVLYSGCGWGCELHQEGII